MISTLSVLKASGFIPATDAMSLALSSLIYDFGNFRLKATPAVNRHMQNVVLFSGVLTTPRSVAEVDFETPLEMDSQEQCWAWIAYNLDRAANGPTFEPARETPWLAIGRANQSLLPGVADQIAYQNRPHCYVEREWAKLLLKSLRHIVENDTDNNDVIFRFDGEVLSILCKGERLAVAGGGNAWPQSYILKSHQLTTLPTRLTRHSVQFAPGDSYFLIGGWRYPMPQNTDSVLDRIRQHIDYPNGTKEEISDEVCQFLMGLWPAHWPSRAYIDLDNLGDPGAWIETTLGEPVEEVLFGYASEGNTIAEALADQYYWDVRGTVPRPSDFAEAGEKIDDKALFTEDFTGFLAAWRENVLKALQ